MLKPVGKILYCKGIQSLESSLEIWKDDHNAELRFEVSTGEKFTTLLPDFVIVELINALKKEDDTPVGRPQYTR